MTDVYVTRYALTRGVFVLKDVGFWHSGPATYAFKTVDSYRYFLRMQKDAHIEWTDALERCKAMQLAEKASLLKQIDRISMLTFTKPES